MNEISHRHTVPVFPAVYTEKQLTMILEKTIWFQEKSADDETMNGGHSMTSKSVERNLRDRFSEIEQELSSIDEIEDTARRKDVMTRLYLLLISRESIRYFYPIFQKSGAENAFVAKDIEDYLSEIWAETNARYDPSKGALLSFLTARMKNRIIDDERKSGGIGSLPRSPDTENRNVIFSIDQTAMAEGQSFTGESFLDVLEYRKLMQDQYEFRSRSERHGSMSGDEPYDLIMDAQLYELASQILNFLESKPASGKSLNRKKRAAERRYIYYRLFYSSDIINYLKMTHNTTAFRHERDAMEAMHFAFTNFCTDRYEKYRNRDEMTPKEILRKPLERNGNVLPQDKLRPENKAERLCIPLQNEVVRGYFERVEETGVSSANISQMKKKYMQDMYERLLEKDLSYAEIAMPQG